MARATSTSRRSDVPKMSEGYVPLPLQETFKWAMQRKAGTKGISNPVGQKWVFLTMWDPKPWLSILKLSSFG